MSDTKFTPGPWQIYKENVMGVGDIAGVRTSDRWVVPRLNLNINDLNLIAAAPELYDALRELLSRVANDKDCHAYWCDAQEQAIKALAKARGEL
jgi:hypothetical protein